MQSSEGRDASSRARRATRSTQALSEDAEPLRRSFRARTARKADRHTDAGEDLGPAKGIMTMMALSIPVWLLIGAIAWWLA